MSNLVEFKLPREKQALTADQIKKIEAAKKMPFVYDEDNPPLTDEQLKQFRRVNPLREVV